MPSAKMTEAAGTYSNYSSPKVRGAEEPPRPRVAVISSEARYAPVFGVCIFLEVVVIIHQMS